MEGESWRWNRKERADGFGVKLPLYHGGNLVRVPLYHCGDPEVALGGHQPHGFNELTGLFANYQVLSSACEATLFPKSESYTFLGSRSERKI